MTLSLVTDDAEDDYDLPERRVPAATARHFYVGFDRDADNRERVLIKPPYCQDPFADDGWHLTPEAATSLAARLLEIAEGVRQHRTEARQLKRYR